VKNHNPIQLEVGEWWYYGCFIQEFIHPSLFGRYEVFKDDENCTHVTRCITKTEAKNAAKQNKVENYSKGPEYFGVKW